MVENESIYNLIPKVIIQPTKPPRYQSQHNPLIKPTGSTFGCVGKTIIEGANLGGDSTIDPKKSTQGLGKVGSKPNPTSFLKKKTDAKNHILQKSPGKFSYGESIKPPVVKKDERPVIGLKSSKDYVTTNAVEAILGVPGSKAKVKQQPPQYKNKADYGKVPAYLKEVKDEIKRENEMIEEFVRENQQLQEEEEAKVIPMDDEERYQLIDSLKAKWDHINSQYQKICHHVIFDSHGKVRRKEQYEKELSQLEKDIEILQRQDIMISKD